MHKLNSLQNTTGGTSHRSTSRGPTSPRLTAVASEYDLCIVGLGAQASRLAALACESGMDVAGFDPDPDAVERFNRGDVDPAWTERIEDGLAEGQLHAFDAATRARTYWIATPATLSSRGTVDTTEMEASIELVLDAVEPGCLIVLEASVAPGTMRRAVAERLEEVGLELGVDVFVATVSYPESGAPIVGGITPACAERAAALVAEVSGEQARQTSAEHAEVARLAETSYREITSAFANELANVCSHLKLDIWEVLALARTPEGGPLPCPSAGASGLRGQLEPELLASVCRHDTPLLQQAQQLNALRPGRVVSDVRRLSKRFVQPTIACLGLTSPNDAPDQGHHSPAHKVAQMIAGERLGSLLVVDPSLEQSPIANATLCSVEHALRTADIVVVLSDHHAFTSAARELYARPCVIDTTGALSR